MVDVLRKKGILVLLAGMLAAALLIWVPMVGRFSLDDPLPVPVNPASINNNPKPFLGRRVQVEGEVERVYGPRAFVLEQDTSGDAPAILVVGRKPWTLLQRNPQVGELLRNDHVQVMGRLRNFHLREFQKESGRHPSDSLLAGWEGRPALHALDIELTPGVPDLFPGGTGGPRSRGMGGTDERGSADPSGPAHADSLFGRP